MVETSSQAVCESLKFHTSKCSFSRRRCDDDDVIRAWTEGAKNSGGSNSAAGDLSCNPLISVMGLTAQGLTPPQSEQSDWT